MIKNIVVVGSGYVGTSLALLLSQKKNVTIVDTDKNKLASIEKRKSPIEDNLAEKIIKKPNLRLTTCDDLLQSISQKNNNIHLVIIALPTNYDSKTNYFDTSIVEKAIEEIVKFSNKILIVIKSTVPIGFTEKMKKKYKTKNIIFVPEFLREGNSIYDNQFPSRIVVGNKYKKGIEISDLFLEISKNDPLINLMDSTEAEAVKLFANTFLATRVTFFNELDSFCIKHGLNSRSVIEGVSNDPRIGSGYNNPSFGYGGYCLPKDTKQLLANFEGIPQGIFTAVVEGNKKRKEFIAQQILDLDPDVVGIYRLIMKSGSDNFRESAIFDVIKIIESHKIKIILFEPLIKSDNFKSWSVVSSIKELNDKSDVIIANRVNEDLSNVDKPVYTRDIFGEN